MSSFLAGLRCRLFALALLAAAPAAGAAGVTVEAPAAIADFLTPYLAAGDAGADPEQARRRIHKRVPELLATEGYFSPVLVFADDDAGLRVSVEPGPRTLVAAVDITITGHIDPEQRQALIADWSLAVGRPFRQAEWSAAKEGLLARLIAVDHPGATLQDSRAEIDPDARTARLAVSVDAGPVYRFGELKIDGLLRYTPELVARYNDSVSPGDNYSEEKLALLQRHLQATPYFSSVQVEIDREGEPGSDGTVVAPVQLRLREAPPHRLGFGVGASSNTGARVEVNYRTADLFRQAWELSSGLRLEQKKQTAYADVFLPPDALRYRHSFGALVEQTDIEGLRTERASVGAQRVQQRGQVEMRLALNWEEEKKFPDGVPASSDHALVANGTWTWRHVDNLLDPRRGQVLQAEVGGAAKALLSDRDFLRLHGRGQLYFPLGQRDTLSLRGEIGYTFAASRQGIPQDYLFRAGGTGSVRGYAYQSLGVREGVATVGGRYMATVSAEATHWLNAQWGVAAFVDAGDAVDDLHNVRLARGYGLGARWRSPAGPIGADLAYGERTGGVQLHFSLAIPF